MRRFGLSLAVLVGAVAAAGAQQNSPNTPPGGGVERTGPRSGTAPQGGATPRSGGAPESGGAPQTGGLKGAFGSPKSATGGLRGVYGPPASGVGQLRGVYGPPQSPAPAPLSSTLAGSSSSNSGSVPNISLPGKATEGQTLPEGSTPSPMPDRPGYGRAMVNDRPAISI